MTTEEDFVEASHEEYAKVFNIARREEIRTQPASQLNCDECGHTIRDHRWITEEGFEELDNQVVCESLPYGDGEDYIYLVYIPPTPPEDPCDEEYMEGISS